MSDHPIHFRGRRLTAAHVPLLGVEAQPWMADAECSKPGADPDVMYPDYRGNNAHVAAERAKAVCRVCTVTEACLAYALERGERWGVWGGLTAGERDKLAGRRPRAQRDDEVLVQRIIDGQAVAAPVRAPGGPDAPELIEAVRRMADDGLTDAEIGRRIGRSRAAVCKVRARNNIAAAVRRPRRGAA